MSHSLVRQEFYASKMARLTAFSAFVVGVLAAAQNISQSIAPSATVNGTRVVDPTAFSTAWQMNIEDFWNIVIGPVTSTPYYTTTVSATPVPSSSLIPPPPLYYSPFPSGQQQPVIAKNESWSFPSNFW